MIFCYSVNGAKWTYGIARLVFIDRIGGAEESLLSHPLDFFFFFCNIGIQNAAMSQAKMKIVNHRINAGNEDSILPSESLSSSIFFLLL